MAYIRADGEGFEPTVDVTPTAVFKTAALDHSATHPGLGVVLYHARKRHDRSGVIGDLITIIGATRQFRFIYKKRPHQKQNARITSNCDAGVFCDDSIIVPAEVINRRLAINILSLPLWPSEGQQATAEEIKYLSPIAG